MWLFIGIGSAGTIASARLTASISALGCFLSIISPLACFRKRAVSGRAMICDLTLEDDFCFLGCAAGSTIGVGGVEVASSGSSC